MIRIGQGFDVHAFAEDRKLILGGIEIPHTKGLLGHSDADVLLHTIADAALGAIAAGDIGKHFPDTDPEFKDADSAKLLQHVYALVKQQSSHRHQSFVRTSTRCVRESRNYSKRTLNRSMSRQRRRNG